MSDPQDVNIDMEDEYDEEADSDFEGDGDEEIISSSSDEEEASQASTSRRPIKRRKVTKPEKVDEKSAELDSGDEATIRERERDIKKQKRQGEQVDDDTNDETQGWRAKTRSIRDRDKEEKKKKNRLATVKGSTADVNKIWEDMNRPQSLHPPKIEILEATDAALSPKKTSIGLQLQHPTGFDDALEEMINIKRTYKFAGEVHTEEKMVLKSSAEAKLWLSQQSPQTKGSSSSPAPGASFRRPLRRISRFDPNHANLAAFQKNWSKDGVKANKIEFEGPKLNTVEKSKQDWAAHVDQEGLQEELEEAAKAKGGYLSRQDFLNEVEQRKEEAARAVRLKGKAPT